MLRSRRSRAGAVPVDHWEPLNESGSSSRGGAIEVRGNQVAPAGWGWRDRPHIGQGARRRRWWRGCPQRRRARRSVCRRRAGPQPGRVVEAIGRRRAGSWRLASEPSPGGVTDEGRGSGRSTSVEVSGATLCGYRLAGEATVPLSRRSICSRSSAPPTTGPPVGIGRGAHRSCALESGGRYRFAVVASHAPTHDLVDTRPAVGHGPVVLSSRPPSGQWQEP